MKKFLVRFSVSIFIIICAGFSLVSNVWAPEKQGFISDSFSYVMVKNLLDLQEDKSTRGGLSVYREWADEVYPVLEKKKLNDKEMKAYFLVVFVTEARAKVHTSEYISETIIQRLEDNTDVFLKTLHDLPYLMPSVASSISGHFSTFSNAREKGKFLLKYSDTFVSYLGDRKGRDFTKFITEGMYSLYY